MKKLTTAAIIAMMAYGSVAVAATSVTVTSKPMSVYPTPEELVKQQAAPQQVIQQQPVQIYSPQIEDVRQVAPSVKVPVVQAPDLPSATLPEAPQILQAPVLQVPTVQVITPSLPDAPVVQTPVVQTPVIQTPVVQAPAVQVPVVQAPTAAPAQQANTKAPSVTDRAYSETVTIKNNVTPKKDGHYDLASVSASLPETIKKKNKSAAKDLPNDAWRQIEFLPLSNGEFLTNQIKALISFKQENWNGEDFNSYMVRPEAPNTFEVAGFDKKNLPKLPKTALLLNGKLVKNGFAYADSKSIWFVYGTTANNGEVELLAISPDDRAPSAKFVKVIKELAGNKFAIVDWYKDTIVDTRTEDAVSAWAKSY